MKYKRSRYFLTLTVLSFSFSDIGLEAAEKSLFGFRCASVLSAVSRAEEEAETERRSHVNYHIRRQLFFPQLMPLDREERIHSLLQNNTFGLLPSCLRGCGLKSALPEIDALLEAYRTNDFNKNSLKAELYVLGENDLSPRFNGKLVIYVKKGIALPGIAAERDFEVVSYTDHRSSGFYFTKHKWKLAKEISDLDQLLAEILFRDIEELLRRKDKEWMHRLQRMGGPL